MALYPPEHAFAENRTLERLFEITKDILHSPEIGPALESIARGLRDLFAFNYVSIVASDMAGGELYRRVLVGFPSDIIAERLGEQIPRDAIRKLLSPTYQVVPNCYYMPAEADDTWAYNIYTGDLPLDAMRSDPQMWHERDSLCLVLADRDGAMLGYISVDGPVDGRVPTRETLRQMQIFVNLVGLALANARADVAAHAQHEFFGKVSHEVRSPLAAIRGATVLLESHFEDLSPERRAELLAVLASSTGRLSAIFEDFLLLSRMEANKLTLRSESVDAIAVLAESVARMRSEHPERQFRIQRPNAVPAVQADEGRVVQILVNFLSNAAKYASEGTPIIIDVTVSADSVRFGVKNDGPGFSEEQRKRLFRRFGLLSASDQSSTGLGLYICAELVALMGGTIGCESEPHRTTTFWFALPRAGA